ncbi:MAG: ADP-heptose--LPS heptosyltransferase [Verrucomicrobia bacterium]|nr:ADP-heptose--LPS heptosyltransferase [Verrucomicrobiota bacterium]
MSPLIRMDHQALQEEVGRLWWQHAMAGDLEQAWRQSDRLLHARVDLSHLPRFFRPIWDGRPLSGADVWLKCWRGLGDAIHYIRYAAPVRARCTRLIVEAPDELHRLFAKVPGIDELVVIDEGRRIGPEFVQIESTELPYALRTTLASIPQTVPYLWTEPAGRVPNDGHRNVGLCWAGGDYDARRHVPLAALAPLQNVPGIRFWQLQRGPALAQIAQAGFRFENLGDETMDVSATGSLVAELDLVITIDSMVAHLAGASAKPVWTLLHAEADWRWFRDRDDSPWYPTMRLYRQTVAGEWRDVIERTAADLQKMPEMTVSVGCRVSGKVRSSERLRPTGP